MKKIPSFFLAFFSFFLVIGQSSEEVDQTFSSNIQVYTPSKLLAKGQWDIKWFNNLYTQIREVNENGKQTRFARQNFFTSSLDLFTGVSNLNRVNLGIVLEYRVNTTRGQPFSEVFTLKNNPDKRSGLTSIAPAIKFTPFSQWEKFSIQTALSFPLLNKERENEVFLDQKRYTWQNRFFYDYATQSRKF